MRDKKKAPCNFFLKIYMTKPKENTCREKGGGGEAGDEEQLALFRAHRQNQKYYSTRINSM